MKKEIVLEQRSPEWIEWRSNGIGASDSAVLMGALPQQWNDVLEFWKVKTGLKESEFVENDAVKFGKLHEPEARDKYIEITGIEVFDKCYERIDMPFMRASMDGITEDEKHIVEIKVPGMPNFQKAKKGIVVDYYYSQMQMQAFVSGAETIHYWVYRPEKGGVLINVPRNEEYIDEMVRRAFIFWKGVETKTPVLPRHLNINPMLDKDPFIAGNMEVEVIGFYKN